MIYINREESARNALAKMLGERVEELDEVLADLDNGEISAEQAAARLGLDDSKDCRCETVCDLLWEAV
jgi:hypothetical protein